MLRNTFPEPGGHNHAPLEITSISWGRWAYEPPLEVVISMHNLGDLALKTENYWAFQWPAPAKHLVRSNFNCYLLAPHHSFQSLRFLSLLSSFSLPPRSRQGDAREQCGQPSGEHSAPVATQPGLAVKALEFWMVIKPCWHIMNFF
jgi:hypothetical protein